MAIRFQTMLVGLGILAGALSGFSQDLILEGPGEVIVSGSKKTPFSDNIYITKASGWNKTFTLDIPQGKTFVCTYLSVSFWNASSSTPASITLSSFNRSTSEHQAKGFFQITPEDPQAVPNYLVKSWSTGMVFMPDNSGSITFSFVANLYGSQSADGSLTMAFNGYLVDAP